MRREGWYCEPEKNMQDEPIALILEISKMNNFQSLYKLVCIAFPSDICLIALYIVHWVTMGLFIPREQEFIENGKRGRITLSLF